MYVLVYDSNCGPCTRFKNAVRFLDTRKRLDYVGLVDADLRGLLDGVPVSRRHRSFHVVTPDGLVVSGSAAFPSLLRNLPAGSLLATLLERSTPLSRAADLLYSVFSRLHDAVSCRFTQGREVADLILAVEPIAVTMSRLVP